MLNGHVTLLDCGTICVLTPLTGAAMEWCNDHLPDDTLRWGSNGYVIEPRYLRDILFGMNADLNPTL